MKQLYIILTTLFFIPSLKEATAQTASCNAPTSQVDLDINNVRARILNAGDMWWDLSGNAGYEVPKGSGVHSFFNGGVWMGGLDAGGNLKMAGVRYRSGGTDYYAGPSADSATCANFDRHWKVNKTEIDQFIQDFANGDTSNIPQVIMEWPGRDNPNLTFDINTSLAPFIDSNNDGIYNPYDGDYPDVPGDQAIWWVFNDGNSDNPHLETGGESFGLQVHALAFAFSNPDTPALNNSTFYKYDIVNKTSYTLDSFTVSKHADPDLGGPFDDFIGCDTARDMGIVYNGDAYDEGGYSDLLGYLPLTGIAFLEGLKDSSGSRLGMTAFTYYINSMDPQKGDPQNDPEYYNFMSGFWKDGSVMMDANGNPTKFQYTGSPDNLAQWSECSEGNIPGDRRFVMSSGPGILEAGSANSVLLGVYWVPDVAHPCPSFGKLQATADTILELYNQGFLLSPPSAVNNAPPPLVEAVVYPNPFSYKTIISVKNSNVENLTLELMDLSGKKIKQMNNPDREGKFVVERGNLSSGIYFYNVRSAGLIVAAGKLVIE